MVEVVPVTPVPENQPKSSKIMGCSAGIVAMLAVFLACGAIGAIYLGNRALNSYRAAQEAKRQADEAALYASRGENDANAGALAECCQRLERVADTATRTLGETFREASTRMRDVYERSERLRAA